MKSYQMLAVINQLEKDKEKLMVERDTYRDLCGEMTKSFRAMQSENDRQKLISAQLDLYSTIDKFEQLLQESVNGN